MVVSVSLFVSYKSKMILLINEIVTVQGHRT